MTIEEAINIAEEFSEWLEDISDKYEWDKDDVQTLIKLFLMWGRRMSENLTELEKKFLTMLIKIGNEIIESQDGYLDFNYESFSRNDLYNLSLKLGIEY